MRIHKWSAKYDIDLTDLNVIHDMLNRTCDDDISDAVQEALDAICVAIMTIENRVSGKLHEYEDEELTGRQLI